MRSTARAGGRPAGPQGGASPFSAGIVEPAVALQALVAAVQQFARLEVRQLAVGIAQCALEEGGHLLVVAVGAAHRLAHDLVHQAQGLEAVGGDAHGVGRVLGLVAGLPEDGGTALGADDRIDRILQHHDLVRDADGQCAAGAALADHRGDDGHFQLRHLEDVAADGLGLAALLGVDAGVGARRVHEGEHGQPEFLGRFHEAQGLAVALGAAHAEVAGGALLGVAPLLVAEHHAGMAVEAREAADDGEVVGEVPVTVHLDEVGEDLAHVVEGVGPLGVAGDLRDLPGRQLAVDVLGELLALAAELVDFLGNVHRAFGLHVAQFLDLRLQLGDGLLEVQKSLFRQLFSPWAVASARAERAARSVLADGQ